MWTWGFVLGTVVVLVAATTPAAQGQSAEHLKWITCHVLEVDETVYHLDIKTKTTDTASVQLTYAFSDSTDTIALYHSDTKTLQSIQGLVRKNSLMAFHQDDAMYTSTIDRTTGRIRTSSYTANGHEWYSRVNGTGECSPVAPQSLQPNKF